MIDIKDKDIFPDSDFLGEEEQGYREAVEEAASRLWSWMMIHGDSDRTRGLRVHTLG